MLTYHNILTEKEKQEICSWKYDGEYAIYNLPPQQQLAENMQGIYNPANAANYYAFYDGDIFIGYINLIERNTKFSVGISVKPDMCGKGYGRQMLEICTTIAKQISQEKPVGLQVRTWNRRAINCYKKAGFEIVGEEYQLTTPGGKGMFYRMVRE